MNIKDIAVVAWSDEGQETITVGNISLTVDGNGEVLCEVSHCVGEIFNITGKDPVERRELLHEYGFTHVLDTLQGSNILYTVEEWYELLTEGEE